MSFSIETSRFRPHRTEIGVDYSLLDTVTGELHLYEQGFGVCTAVADALNYRISHGSWPDTVGEIGELAESIHRSLE